MLTNQIEKQPISADLRQPVSIETAQKTVIFSNIIELVTGVIRNTSSSEVRDAMNKDGLSGVVLSNVVANRIKEVVTSVKS